MIGCSLMGGCAVMCYSFFHRDLLCDKINPSDYINSSLPLKPILLVQYNRSYLDNLWFWRRITKKHNKNKFHYYSSLTDWNTFTSNGLSAVQTLINSTQHKNPCPPDTLFMALLRGGITLSTNCLQDIMTWSGPVCLQVWCTVLITSP